MLPFASEQAILLTMPQHSTVRFLRTRLRSVGFIEPCIPTITRTPPSGPQWIHEIKLDGYRLIVWKRGDCVRLFTRRGFDWTERYRLIAAAVAALSADATIDGEAMVCITLAPPISSVYTAAGAMTRRSFTPLICSSWTAPTCARCRSSSARSVCASSCKAARPAFSSTITSRAMASRCFPAPANWVSRASSVRIARVPIAQVRARRGSRSTIRRRLASPASRIAMRRRDLDRLRRVLARLLRRIPKKPPGAAHVEPFPSQYERRSADFAGGAFSSGSMWCWCCLLATCTGRDFGCSMGGAVGSRHSQVVPCPPTQLRKSAEVCSGCITWQSSWR
jgi:hypothetical protein